MSYLILKKENAHKIQGVLFDMDGIVLDTETLYTKFWIKAAKELGYSMTHEQSLGMRSLNSERSQKYLETCFGPGIQYKTLREVRIRHMEAWIEEHGIDVKPGIYELLDYLHQNKIPCAITSSSPMKRIKKYLTPLHLYEQFDNICSGYEVAHGKPEPDIYLEGASCIHLAPSSCLALEDSSAGIESAFRAGCMPVIIPDLDQPGETILKQSFAKADSLLDIIPLIESLNLN